MLSNVKTILSRHFSGHIIIYFLVILCFSIGIASGVFSVRALNQVQKDQLIDYLVSSFKTTLVSGQMNANQILLNSVLHNIKTIVIIWALSISVFAFPLILGVVGIRGFILGFTVGFLIDNLGYKGIIFATVSILPQNLIYIPLLMILSVVSINYSLVRIKNRKNKRYIKSDNLKLILKYSILCVILTLFFLIGSVVESYLSPAFIKGISGYLIN